MLAGGGYFAYDTFIDTGPGGSEGAARDFISALDGGDTERANELLRSGSVDEFTASAYAEGDVSIQGSEIVEEGDGFAEVTVELTAADTDRTWDARFTMEETEDGWRVVEYNNLLGMS